MTEVFKKCMTTDFATFSGRARRREYWLFSLAVALINVVVNLLTLIAESSSSAAFIGLVTFVSLVVGVVILIPSIAVSVRRLHDIGRSGLWFLIVLVPIAGAIVLLVFALMPGVEGENEYGPDPKASPSPTEYAFTKEKEDA